ncbi:hypothetical protein EZS27_038060, partial [termite gut metagenome]
GIRENAKRANFLYSSEFGGQTSLDVDPVNSLDAGIYSHVVVTYDKNAKEDEDNIFLYVDGKLLKSVGSAELKEHGLKFPADYYASSNGQHTHDRRTPNTEYLVISGGSHQSGHPTSGVTNGTKVMVARVYGHALTPVEVKALYDSTSPE